MKRVKISMAALIVAACLVASFAFTNKKFFAVDVVYSPASGQFQTAKGTPGVSIIATELKDDVAPADGVPDSWSTGSIAANQAGSNLLGMEYQPADYSSLQLFANAAFAYYNQAGVSDLPANGATFADISNSSKLITVFRQP